jgi:hypothetical protein
MRFLKLTPLSRTSAIAGAVSGVTFNARNPSGMNRIMLCGVLFWASAVPADSTARPADSNRIERRMNISPREADLRPIGRGLSLVLPCDRFVTSVPGRLRGNYTLSESLRPARFPPSKTSDPAW